MRSPLQAAPVPADVTPSTMLDVYAGRLRAFVPRKKPRKPWSVRVVRWLGDRSIRALKTTARGIQRLVVFYPKARSFALAHSACGVYPGEKVAREASCDKCPFKYWHEDEAFCRGDNSGCGCGCGHGRAARLSHKVRLAAWRCPIGRFDWGGDLGIILKLIRSLRWQRKRKSG